MSADFTTALATAASAVEAMMDQLLPQAGQPAPDLVAAMRYAALGPGKRLRPFFVIEAARLYGVSGEGVLRTAAALEFVHCYSLVHDDLPAMDDDDLRRGRPTTHIAHGEAAAILAGDALLTYAFEILAAPATDPDPAVRASLVLELARAAGKNGMCGGQMRDIAAEKARITDPVAIAELQAMKTGALFSFALESGATLARASAADRAALNAYAAATGLAFQIADDILDHEASAEDMGKRTGKDRAAGKASFVDIHGLAGAKARAEGLVSEAAAALQQFGARGGLLREAARFIVTRQR